MKARITISFVLFFAFSGSLFPQSLSDHPIAKNPSYVEGQYYVESFEGDAFPPEGWRSVCIYGPYPWMQNQYSQHTGQCCATTALNIPIADNINGAGFINQVSGPYDHPELNWLITPRYTVMEGDSLIFYMEFDPYEESETLSVLISSDEDFASDSLSLEAAFRDTLLISYGYESDFYWKRFAFSLDKYTGKKIYIGFKDCSSDNGYVFLDDIKLGQSPAADIATTYRSVKEAMYLKKGAVLNPRIYFVNEGYQTQSFTAVCEISPGGYKEQIVIDTLEPDDAFEVKFSAWVPETKGIYKLKYYSSLEGDGYTGNDTAYVTINVIDVLEKYIEYYNTTFGLGLAIIKEIAEN
jgi:hypothetical protein